MESASRAFWFGWNRWAISGIEGPAMAPMTAVKVPMTAVAETETSHARE